MKTKAAFIAKLAHDATGATYKGKPYFAKHVVEVAEKAASMEGATDKHIAVAYLHDVIEDTAVTLEGLALFFDAEIIEALDALTKREGESYFPYIDRVKKNKLALFVKYADITVNLGNKPPSKLANKYKIALDIVERAFDKLDHTD